MEVYPYFIAEVCCMNEEYFGSVIQMHLNHYTKGEWDAEDNPLFIDNTPEMQKEMTDIFERYKDVVTEAARLFSSSLDKQEVDYIEDDDIGCLDSVAEWHEEVNGREYFITLYLSYEKE